VLDFKIFKGSTTGAILYEYQNNLLELEDENPFVVMGIMDTTGNMGVLTQLCRAGGNEAGYCTEHNFHLNAQIAFNGL
jgi:hypothetical protein